MACVAKIQAHSRSKHQKPIAAISMKRNETLTLKLSSSKSCSEDAALF
jgi:hypothetical protein